MDISFPVVVADAVVGISLFNSLHFFTFLTISARLMTKKDWQFLL